jgi:hypothetical protein
LSVEGSQGSSYKGGMVYLGRRRPARPGRTSSVASAAAMWLSMCCGPGKGAPSPGRVHLLGKELASCLLIRARVSVGRRQELPRYPSRRCVEKLILGYSFAIFAVYSDGVYLERIFTGVPACLSRHEHDHPAIR